MDLMYNYFRLTWKEMSILAIIAYMVYGAFLLLFPLLYPEELAWFNAHIPFLLKLFLPLLLLVIAWFVSFFLSLIDKY